MLARIGPIRIANRLAGVTRNRSMTPACSSKIVPKPARRRWRTPAARGCRAGTGRARARWAARPGRCFSSGVNSARYRIGVENPTNSHTGLRSSWSGCRWNSRPVSRSVFMRASSWCSDPGPGPVAPSRGSPSRSDRPVWRRNTSSRVGSDRLIERIPMRSASSSRISCGSAVPPSSTYSRSWPSSARELAHVRLGSQHRRGRGSRSRGVARSCAQADHDGVAGDLRLSSRGVPSATIWPWSMIIRRSQSASASSR